MVRAIFGLIAAILLVPPLLAQDWQPVTTELLKAEKTGFGGLCGVVIDPANGHIIINLSDNGFFRSTDRGKSWQPLGPRFKGRTETPGCLMLDPTGGKRLVSAFVYGSPIRVSSDRGENSEPLHNKSNHVDWCAIDWSDPKMRFILTLKHEAADLLLVSRDAGKSFEEIGKGFGPAWIFDRQTAVVAQAKSKTNPNPKLLRTTDAGKTFESCGDFYAKALPRGNNDHLFWLVDGALIHTKDQAKSWTKISDLKDGRFGPVFGKNIDHMLVLTGAGIRESTDGGNSWGKVVPIPKEMKGLSSLSWLAYDPTHNDVYIMKMGSELYRWQRD